MPTDRRPELLGLATPLLAVVLAVAYASGTHGRLGELPAFMLWSAPLGFIVRTFAQRPRLTTIGPYWRAIVVAGIGGGVGLGMTLVGYLVIGGWMMTWDFPVLYCWSIAGIAGFLTAIVSDGSARNIHAGPAFLIAITPLLFAAWYSVQPSPGVLISFSKDPEHDAAQFALDSLLTQPHPSGQGRVLRWPDRLWNRWDDSDSTSKVLIVLENASDRDSVRHALIRYPYVLSIRDTLLDR